DRAAAHAVGRLRKRAVGRGRNRGRRCDRHRLAAAGARRDGTRSGAGGGARTRRGRSMTTTTGARRARLFIDGAWTEGAARTRPVLDKYSGDTIGIVESASREQVDAAVAAARRSFEQTVL